MTIKRAKESFTYWDDKGVPRDIPAGTLVDPEKMSGYKGREHLFEDVDVYVDRVESKKEVKPSTARVEKTTANPDEKRSLTTPTVRPLRSMKDEK